MLMVVYIYILPSLPSTAKSGLHYFATLFCYRFSKCLFQLLFVDGFFPDNLAQVRISRPCAAIFNSEPNRLRGLGVRHLLELQLKARGSVLSLGFNGGNTTVYISQRETWLSEIAPHALVARLAELRPGLDCEPR